MRATSGEIQLTVNDQGVGFDQQDAVHRHGLGLVSMQERTRLVGGELSIKSEPGELILPIDLLKTGVTYLAWLWSGDISKCG
jgi:signal transduction histidine kinase